MNEQVLEQPAETMLQKLGFTLIELSIVLVIIGLIVGGVLVGQDLIRAAEIRATVAQVDKYNSAVNAFRNKYNGIPGDIAFTTASQLGFFNTGMTGAAGLGDGNGLIEGGSAGAVIGVGETLVFWRHLTDATMIDGAFGNAGNSSLVSGGAPSSTVTNISQSLPPAKLGRGNYFTVYANNGQNFYQITGVTSITTAGAYTLTAGLTPIEARNIDTKLDDGLPASGNVQAMYSTTALDVAATPQAGDASAAGNCTLTGTPNTYDIGTAGGNIPNCQLRLRFN